MQTGIKVSNSLIKKLNPIIPIDGYIQFVSDMKINDLKLDTFSVVSMEKHAALFPPDVAVRDSNVIGHSFLNNFGYMLYDSHNKQIRFYGYHENNQGEKDLIKALKKNN